MSQTPPRPAGLHIRLKQKRDGSDDSAWKYEVPKFLTLDGAAVDVMRRDAVTRRDHFVAMQKEFGAAQDRDNARWAKDEAGDALKEYRACCLLLGQLWCEPPGDSPFIPEWEWPVELAPWLDRVIRVAERVTL